VKLLASPFSKTTENPVPFLLYHAMAALGVEVKSCGLRYLIFDTWDVWHLNWPAEDILSGTNRLRAVAKLARFWLRLKVARAKKIKIFWTVHNLKPHDVRHPVLARIFWWLFLPSVDGLILMSRSTVEKIHRELPYTNSRPIFVIPHGHYRGAYSDSADRKSARARLGLNAPDLVICFFGQIRPYKGVPNLIKCFRQLGKPGTSLIVAGKPLDRDIASEVTKAAAGDPKVRLHLEYVDQDSVQFFLRAADLVVLPYTEILNSGSALLALSFDRPILVPSMGAIPDLCEVAGDNWVRMYDGELTPKILSDAMQWTRGRPLGEFDHAFLDELDWNRLAQLTIEAFRSLGSAGQRA
jgi:beta-1,4-mannosyltransferase